MRRFHFKSVLNPDTCMKLEVERSFWSCLKTLIVNKCYLFSHFSFMLFQVKKAPKEEPIPIKIEAPAIKLEEAPRPSPKVEQHLAKEEAAAILMAIPTFQIGSSTSFQQHMNSSFQQHMVSTTTAPFNPPQACILFKSPSPQYNISPPQPVSSQQFSPPQSTITAPQYTTSPRQPISSPRQQHPSPRPSSSPRHSNKAYQFANPHSSHPNASPHSSTSPHYPGVSPHSTASPHSTQLPSPLHASSSSPRGPKSPPKMVKLPVQRPSQSKTDFIISENILHSQIGKFTLQMFSRSALAYLWYESRIEFNFLSSCLNCNFSPCRSNNKAGGEW